jgi:hypothetical protein
LHGMDIFAGNETRLAICITVMHEGNNTPNPIWQWTK